jgi:teichuronic acid exporter
MKSFRQKTITGLKWSALEHFSSQGLAFIINIIIARILIPSDYGIIGLIAVFMEISQMIINAGFAAALIRKQDRSDKDFSTVFYYNVFASICLYLLLFISAPLIADFYKMPILIPVTRVAGLNMIIASLSTIHITKLTIAVNFKMLTKISLISTLITGMLGILLAYHGYRVWALVIQGLATSVLSTILLWLYVKWIPQRVFSTGSFRNLFGFGSKLMLSGLLHTVYNNLYQMIIGKKYSTTDLGYFTRAIAIVQLPSNNITEVIQRVTFPVLSEMQQDVKTLTNYYQRLLKMSAFVIFPIMAFLMALSEPLVRLILTDKWLPIVPFVKVLCLSYMFYPIHAINLNLLKVKGRPELFLRLEIIKKIIITIVLLASVPFGVLMICCGTVVSSVIALIINTHYTGKLIEHGFLKQMNDLKPAFLISILCGLTTFLPTLYFNNLLLQLFIGFLAGSIMLFGSAHFLKINELSEVKSIISGIKMKGLAVFGK